MDNNQFKNEVELKQLEARCQAYLDSNKATAEVGRAAVRGVFILNGAAAVYIIYAKAENFYGAALWFGCGALLACVATSLAYFASYFIAETWKDNLGVKTCVINPIKWCGPFHLFTIIATAISLGLFALGLWEINPLIKKVG